jgi:hypothetical protein
MLSNVKKILNVRLLAYYDFIKIDCDFYLIQRLLDYFCIRLSRKIFLKSDTSTRRSGRVVECGSLENY